MKAEPQHDTASLRIAREALRLLAGHQIEPTPMNYAVWYHYVLGDKKELSDEIDQILRKRTLKITEDVNTYLYNKYITPMVGLEEAAVTASSHNAQAVLTEIMQAIHKFTGETTNYNKQIDEQVDKISSTITDPALKNMAKEIINHAVAIRESGQTLNHKLEESRHEVTQLKTTLERVTNEASRDFLTGTGNRKALESKLEELTKWAKEHTSELTLLMVDVDHFKKFNDKHGHPLGDEVLRKVGRALFESVKGKDFVARYGGEEFAILLPSTNLAGGLAVAENIRKNISENDLVRKDTGESVGQVTVSIGVARYRPESDSIAMLISRADNALYRSKMGGRNRVTPESFES